MKKFTNHKLHITFSNPPRPSGTPPFKRRGIGATLFSFSPFLLFSFLLFSSSALFAQDVIVTKEGNKVNSKVTEINENDIKYKKFENLDGPTYTMKKSEIATIIYESGQVEVFNLNAIPQKNTVANPVFTNSDYLRAKKLRDAGIGCFAAGLAVWVTGAALYGAAEDSFFFFTYNGTLYYYFDEEMWNAGVSLFAIGGATTISGIVMWAVGQSQMKRINANGYSLFENKKMQLNLALGGNSMGLKLNF